MKTKSIFLVLALVAFVVLSVNLYVVLSSKTLKVLSEDDAIDIMLIEYPKLAEYQTTDLPPSSILSKQRRDGWYLGFIQRGSGVPGILDAQCYFVNNDKTITVIGEYTRESEAVVQEIALETCLPGVSVSEAPPNTPEVPPITPEITTGLGLGERGTFEDIAIIPLSVEEDSRCPVDVTCIQAGTVRLKIQVISRSGTSTSIVTLGKSFTTEGVQITLTDVTPIKNSKITTVESSYRFNFTVVKQDTPVVINPNKKCYIGGCSAQLCSDQPDMVSTCEFREQYACYQTAVCERQVSGQCGWTETTELRACLGT